MSNTHEYVDLLKMLIATPSFSREESATADIIASFLAERGVDVERYGNNVVARHHVTSDESAIAAPTADATPARGAVTADETPARSAAPYLLLNSHHDTVRPGGGWTTDPFAPTLANGALFGLGSNDAGGPLVTMLATFMHLRTRNDLTHDIMFAATAEEEISGTGGMEMLASMGLLERVALAIVGEPTQMQMAIAERGLIVLDCESHGRTGHAARSEGVNAIYAAMRDIDWFRTHRFARHSEMLGNVVMTVTQIASGSQHNVVPDICRFVVDVRVTDAYTNEEVLDEIRQHVACTVTPRSMRLRPSSMPLTHPFVSAAAALNIPLYASPTMSDQSLLPEGIPSVKIGPGDSARSHTPNEYITIDELHSGIAKMIDLCERYLVGIASDTMIPAAVDTTILSVEPQQDIS